MGEQSPLTRHDDKGRQNTPTDGAAPHPQRVYRVADHCGVMLYRARMRLHFVMCQT